MSRFNNLEFGKEFEEPSQTSKAVKDEAYYLSEGRLAFEGGRFEQALRAYARALEQNPSHPAAWTLQVRTLIELDESHEAKLWADRALQQFPQESELLAAKAVALGRVGDGRDAIAFSDASFEAPGGTGYLWIARGDVLLSLKEKRSEYCFEKAMLKPSQPWVFAWLCSRVLHWHQHYLLAMKHAQKAVELDPCQPMAWFQLGVCQQRVGFSESAIQSLHHALELDPGCSQATAALRLCRQEGTWTRWKHSIQNLFSK